MKCGYLISFLFNHKVACVSANDKAEAKKYYLQYGADIEHTPKHFLFAERFFEADDLDNIAKSKTSLPTVLIGNSKEELTERLITMRHRYINDRKEKIASDLAKEEHEAEKRIRQRKDEERVKEKIAEQVKEKSKKESYHPESYYKVKEQKKSLNDNK